MESPWLSSCCILILILWRKCLIVHVVWIYMSKSSGLFNTLQLLTKKRTRSKKPLDTQVADIFWILNRAIWMCKYPFLNFEWGNLNVQVSTPGVASAYKLCQSLGLTPAAPQSWFYNPSMTNKSQRARVFFPKCFKLHSSNLSSKSFYYSGHQVSSRLRTISTLTRKLSLSNPRYVWSNQV